MGDFDRGFNAGLETAIAVIRGGIHAASRSSDLWGVQDDEQIYIAAIANRKRSPTNEPLAEGCCE